MTVILDTDLLLPHERADAIEHAMQLSGIPALLTHEPPIDEVFARIELWPLGGGTTLMHRDGSGVCLTRTPQQVRAVAPERVAVTVLGPGRWSYAQGRHDEQVESHRPEMVVTDHAVPYEFTRIGGGETFRSIWITPPWACRSIGFTLPSGTLRRARYTDWFVTPSSSSTRP